MPALPPSLDIEALRERSQESLYFFAKAILGYDWICPHIHRPLCDFLQDQTINRKKIILPRGWLKTTLCSISFPIWLSVQNPNIRVLLVQNSSTNASKKLGVIGDQWERNGLLKALYPELLPSRSSVWQADSKCLTRSASHAESTYEAAGTSTRVVSRHYDVIIEDDTVAPDFDELGMESLAPTHDDVQKAIGWHKTNVLPLMNNPSKDLSLVVGTRWYDRDLLKWIEDNEPSYKTISRASRENELGQPDSKGKITYPERFNEQTLSDLEHSLGPYMYSCLYMNQPIRSEDMLFKAEWFKFYETPPRFNELACYTTIDPATDPSLAISDNIDYSVVMTCGKDLISGEIFVLEYTRERCNPGRLASIVFDHVVKYQPVVVGYENVAFQRNIEYWLKEMMRQQNVYFILEPTPRGGKNAKDVAIRSLQPLFASGVIYLRPHMKELQSELLKFPLGDHDDIADALSMQLQLWRRTKSNYQKKHEQFPNPLLFETALAELKRRKRGQDPLSSMIFDPMRSHSDYGISRSPA